MSERGDARGLLLMVASAAAFAAMAPLTLRYLQGVASQSIVCARSVVMVLVFGAWARARGISISGSQRPRLVLRGLLGYAAISCYVASTQHLAPSDAVLLQYSHPVWVAALAPFLLRERIGPLHWPLVLAAFGGLVLAIGYRGHVTRGTFVGLSGAVLSGFAYMTVRNLAATEAPLTIVFWFALVMLPASLVGMLLGVGESHGVPQHLLPRNADEWTGYAGVVLAGLVGQIVLTEGLARAGAARAVAVTMTGPLFGILFDRLFFGHRPTGSALVGTAIVVAALATLAWLKPPPEIAPSEPQ